MTRSEASLNLDAVVASLKGRGYRVFPPEANISKERNPLAWEFDHEFLDLIKGYNRLHETNRKSSMYSTFLAVKYLKANSIRGDFVECGVFWGRQIMMMTLTLAMLSNCDQEIWLYDTFSGLTKPGEHDAFTFVGKDAGWVKDNWLAQNTEGHNNWCYAPLEEVMANIEMTNYPGERLHFVQGDVLETLPNDNHSQISLLRLDTDFYDSTKHELETLYDLVVPGGIVIIDDYGAFSGAKKAVDEFLSVKEHVPFLIPINGTEVCFIKPR